MPFLLSQLIEAFRWLGALAVVGLHATNLFVNQADIMSASHAPPVYVWWFLTGFESGHQAVVGFFVISGYLVGGAVLARLSAPDRFLRDYFINRLSRVYIVLIPALTLTFILDFTGRYFFTSSTFYDGAMFKGHFTAGLLFTSLLNLQGIYYDYFGTDGPLWSCLRILVLHHLSVALVALCESLCAKEQVLWVYRRRFNIYFSYFPA